jgi:hypothetical protein
MLYAVKDLACARRMKPFRRQGIDSAFEDCYKMAGAAGLCVPGGG